MNNFLLRIAAYSMQKALIFSVILGGIYYFTMFNDGSSIDVMIQATQKEIKEEEIKAQASDAANKEVEQVRATVGALSDQFKMVSQALPSDMQMADIIRAVDTTARAAGVFIKTKEPRPPVNHDYFEEIPLRVTLEGTYSEITLFIYYMASQERIMRVKNFSVILPPTTGPGADKSNSGRLIFDGQVVTYRFIAEKAGKGGKNDVKGNAKK